MLVGAAATLVVSLTAGCAATSANAAEITVNKSKPAAATAAVTYGGPLHTNKGNIVDANGKVVHITGVNWFGFETGTFAPHGLWARNWQDMLNQMVKSGFNTIRLPYSNDIFNPANKPNGINYQLNPDLQGLSALQLMDRIIQGATSRGLMVLLDQHRPDQYGQSDLWYTDHLSEQQWINDWVTLAKRYKNNPRVIGADLHNEPHGQATWGDGNPKTDWRLAAEKAGNAILAANPNWLIVVEGTDHYGNNGTWWGGDLAGVKQYPVQLSVPNRVVYSPHDYGPGVYNQNWFQAKDFPKNMPAFWDQHWGYIAEQGIAPVLLGEFGGRSATMNTTEGQWQNALIAYLKQHGMSYTYWCWNADSGDTGGILNNDWTTVDQSKLQLLQKYESPVPAAVNRAATATKKQG